jgi:hypothetical protein
MTRLLVALLIVLAAGASQARERAIRLCDKAPLLTTLNKKLPDHVLATSADVQPKLISTLPVIGGPLIARSGGASLICVAVVIDADGTTQGAMVSYPRSLSLTSEEQKLLMDLRWSPAMVDGNPRPSLTSLVVTFDE